MLKYCFLRVCVCVKFSVKLRNLSITISNLILVNQIQDSQQVIDQRKGLSQLKMLKLLVIKKLKSKFQLSTVCWDPVQNGDSSEDSIRQLVITYFRCVHASL